MKNIKYIILFVIMFIGISQVKAFDNTLKIYDYAQVLTQTEEIQLKKEIDKYISKNNVDMVIVTVKHYTQSTLQNYIQTFYVQNNFGIGSNKSAIIIVLDLKNNTEVIGIETFGFASVLYSNDEKNNILTHMNSENNYYDKLSSFITHASQYAYQQDDTSVDDNFKTLLILHLLGMLSTAAIIPTIVIVVGLLKNKSIKKVNDANNYVKKDSIIINKKQDTYISTNTKKERINKK